MDMTNENNIADLKITMSHRNVLRLIKLTIAGYNLVQSLTDYKIEDIFNISSGHETW